MTLYRSKPTQVEAIQHTADGTYTALQEFAPGKVDIRPDDGSLLLYAGAGGAQEWVPVPLGHWLVHQPGDLSDIWPVEDAYFRAKYELATDDAWEER